MKVGTVQTLKVLEHGPALYSESQESCEVPQTMGDVSVRSQIYKQPSLLALL